VTGFAAADVLGGPPPHLNPVQRAELAAELPRFEEWAADVPAVRQRTHADGHLLELVVTRYVRLHDGAGGPAGVGEFFRAARPDDPLVHLRNAHSQRLSSSVRTAEAVQAIADLTSELLGAERAYLLRRRDGRWAGWLAAGDDREVAERLGVPDPLALDRAVAGGRCAPAALEVAGALTPVVLVPAGPPGGGAVMALVGGRLAAEAQQDLALALAAEALATLQRVEALAELEAKVEVLEAIAGVAAVAGQDTGAVAGHVVRRATEALSCERGALYLTAPDGGMALAALHDAAADAHDADPAAPAAPDGLLHRQAAAALAAMVDGDGVLVVQDVARGPDLPAPWGRDDGVVSLHALPLAVGERRIGLLVLAHTLAAPRGFTSLCLQVAGALAEQAALAISTAQLLDARREAAERSDRADQQRADWVAGITHDLRSPVTAIVGFVRTLRRVGARMDDAERDTALEVIERQSMRVSRMLEDMMDAARAQADQLRPELGAPVDLAACVEDAVAVTAPEDRRRIAVDARPGVVACGDAGQLTRVVQNLVVNALTHTPSGTAVEVVVDRDGDLGVVRVADRGPGLPADVDLFSPYARGPRGGTGLGLYTVRRIVELHGGRIAVAETPGGGATFEISVPLAPDGGCGDRGPAPAP
jgi:signal transduction histidine kinase